MGPGQVVHYQYVRFEQGESEGKKRRKINAEEAESSRGNGEIVQGDRLRSFGPAKGAGPQDDSLMGPGEVVHYQYVRFEQGESESKKRRKINAEEAKSSRGNGEIVQGDRLRSFGPAKGAGPQDDSLMGPATAWRTIFVRLTP
jgi:hypothetical protein